MRVERLTPFAPDWPIAVLKVAQQVTGDLLTFLGPEGFELAVRLNILQDQAGVCHFHDRADANQILIDACIFDPHGSDEGEEDWLMSSIGIEFSDQVWRAVHEFTEGLFLRGAALANLNPNQQDAP